MKKAKEPGFYQAVSLQRFKEAKKEVFEKFEELEIILGGMNDKLNCLPEIQAATKKLDEYGILIPDV